MTFARTLVLLAAMASGNAFAYTLSPPQALRFGTSWPDAVAIGDIDGDGRNDVVITTTDIYPVTTFQIQVFFQQPDGRLGAPQLYDYGWGNETGLAMADLDHDGRMEIVVGHGGITIFDWSVADHAMQQHEYYDEYLLVNAIDVAVLDVNRDGNLDVVGQSWSDGAIVFLGDGKGGIRRMWYLDTPPDGYNDVEVGDFNGDGHQDFVALSGQGTTHAYVYYNDPRGTLSRMQEIDPNPGHYVTIGALGAGDFDGNGRQDLVVMHDPTSLAIFHQGANGVLQATPELLDTMNAPNAIVGRDLDLDGRDDLVVLHADGPLGYYVRNKTGMGPEVDAGGMYASWFNTQGLAVDDFSGDGCPDVATANPNEGLVVYYGSGCNTTTDLGVSVGLTSSVVALRLDDYGPALAAAPEAILDLSLVDGTLTVGTLPAGCTLSSQTTRTVRITCTGDDLVAGTSRTLLLPISIAGGDARNVLRASASATTTTDETRLANNVASRILRSISPTLAKTLLRVATKPVAPRAR